MRTALLVLALVAHPMITEAAFIAYICNDVACAGGGDLAVTDQTAPDLNAVVGVINAQGQIGGLMASVNVSQSKPAIGSAASPQLDLNFTATGVGEAWFYASDTGYTGVTTLGLQIGGTSTGNPISVSTSVGGGSTNANLIPGAPVLASIGPLTTTPFTGSTSTGLVGNTVNPYSLTLGVHVVQNGGTSTGDALVNVPEPASILLLGVGLVSMGVLSRRQTARI